MIEVTKPRAIALGYFDGVHLGHRALMQRAVERAKQIGGTSAVFTFDVHPDSVVMGRQVPTADRKCISHRGDQKARRCGRGYFRPL